LDAISHSGVAGVDAQWLFSVQPTHFPLDEHPWVAGLRSEHCLWVPHFMHTFPKQMGASTATQSVLVTHASHMLVVGSQKGFPGKTPQSEWARHCAHPPRLEHNGFEVSRSKHCLLVAHFTHAPPVQIGVPSPHPVLVVQPTQVLVRVSHTRLPPWQSLVFTQATQVPVEVKHAGLALFLAAHCSFPVHATQELSTHIGSARFVQVPLFTHSTHCPPASGVPAGAHTLPAQAFVPACSQPTHVPPTQKALPGSLQSSAPAHSTQTFATHRLRVPGQSPAVLHPTMAVSTTGASTAGASTSATSITTGASFWISPPSAAEISGARTVVSGWLIRASATPESKSTQDLAWQICPDLQSFLVSHLPGFNSVIALQPNALTTIATNKALRPIRILQQEKYGLAPAAD
jgi:hypothetical protein